MIRYSLTCADGHAFDSWFASATAYDDLAGRGLLACAACGSTAVAKALMAPTVRTDRRAKASAGPPGGPPGAPSEGASGPKAPGSLTAPRDPREAALARMRARIEAESDYVGLSFAAEARAMHEGEVPHRSIYGEARPAEARALIEDGIPVAPLPFLPKRQAN